MQAGLGYLFSKSSESQNKKKIIKPFFFFFKFPQEGSRGSGKQQKSRRLYGAMFCLATLAPSPAGAQKGVAHLAELQGTSQPSFRLPFFSWFHPLFSWLAPTPWNQGFCSAICNVIAWRRPWLASPATIHWNFPRPGWMGPPPSHRWSGLPLP